MNAINAYLIFSYLLILLRQKYLNKSIQNLSTYPNIFVPPLPTDQIYRHLPQHSSENVITVILLYLKIFLDSIGMVLFIYLSITEVQLLPQNPSYNYSMQHSGPFVFEFEHIIVYYFILVYSNFFFEFPSLKRNVLLSKRQIIICW